MDWTRSEVARIAKQHDQQVMQGLLAAVKESGLKFESSHIEVVGGPGFSAEEEIAKQILQLKGFAVATFTVSLRMGDSQVTAAVERIPDAPTDRIICDFSPLARSYHSQPTEVEVVEAAKLVTALRKRLKSLDVIKFSSELFDRASLDLVATRDAELNRLQSIGESLLEQVARDVVRVRGRLEAEYARRRQEGEAEVAGEIRRLNEEFERRKEELGSRARDLEERAAQLDSLDERAARRRDRQELKKELASSFDSFRLTEGTIKLRRPVAIACYVMFAVFAVLLVATTYANIKGLATSMPYSERAALGVEQALVSAVFISICVFYIRWSNQWFERHAREEFRLKRFSLDLDRASWLAELTMEWQKERQDPFPDILLERFTTDLFTTDRTSKDLPIHPAEHIASAILGASSKAKLSLGGAELELDRKGIRELQRSQAAAAE